MEIIIKIAMIGVVISILVVLLKNMQSNIAPLLTVLGSVLILTAVINMANNAVTSVKKLFESSKLESETINAVIKIIAIAYTVDFSASLCRDMGENSLASKIEAAGRIFIVMTALPWAATLLEAVQSISG